jgi:soluble lytic murein transglycosylase
VSDRARTSGASVGGAPGDGARRSRARTSRARRRGLLRLAVLLMVVAALAVAAALIATGRWVVPEVSGQVYPIHYREGIARVAERYDLDPYLVAAMVNTESGYNPEAVSSAGAVGLMQLMPDTADWVTGLPGWQGGDSPDLSDPDDNLELGACYLRYLIDMLGGGTRPALAAYNAGQGVVGGWIAAAGGEDRFDLDDIVYPETRAFVERVERYWELYARVHPDAFPEAEGPA